MRWSYKPYVPVAERRRKADKKMAALRKKGEAVEPVTAATPRGKIATSVWGQAWCEHLESYSDFRNRLPRGRTYLRNGSVCHLGITTGRIDALVMGSSLYKQSVRIDPLPKAKWEALKKRCQGKVGSLVELLQGKLSGEIMALVTDRQTGIFPSPKEIHLDCNCPDWADLCKHLAAVLYGVGARLDDAPELLFKLRGVDHTELIAADAAALTGTQGRRRRLAPGSIGAVFGDEMLAEDPPEATAGSKPKTARKRSRTGLPSDPNAQSAPKPTRQPKPQKPKTAKLAKQAKANRKPTPKSASQKPTPFQPEPAAVRELRERLNLSRAAFARQLGVSAPTVTNWESATGKLNLQPRSLAALRKLHRSV
ncbi:MAG: helix-turn-helix domain-containing protein [Opitutales bacterium]